MRDIVCNIVGSVINMRGFIIHITIIGICCGCRSAGVIPSQFQTDISIDGMDKEWPTLTKVKYREKYSYGVFNDYEKVYFLFKTFNPRLVKIISEQGMTVWINGNGSKVKELGVTYLPAPKFKTMEEAKLSEQRPDQIQEKKLGLIKGIQRNGTLFELVDLAEDSMIASLGKEEDGKYLIYEAQFSFSTIRQYAREKNIEKGKLLLTLEFGPLVRRSDNAMVNSSGSANPSQSTVMSKLPYAEKHYVSPMTSNDEIYVKAILVKR